MHFRVFQRNAMVQAQGCNHRVKSDIEITQKKKTVGRKVPCVPHMRMI